MKIELDYSQQQYIRNLVERAIYANFNEEQRALINIDQYVKTVTKSTIETLELMVEHISWAIEQQPQPEDTIDTLEMRETDLWHQ